MLIAIRQRNSRRSECSDTKKELGRESNLKLSIQCQQRIIKLSGFKFPYREAVLMLQ